MPILFSPDSVFLQRFLRAGGYYKHDIDGIIGKFTNDAVDLFAADTANVKSQLGGFDARTERTIATMLVPTQRAARKFMTAMGQAVLGNGLHARLISGTRTFTEQDELYAKGRTTPGPKVTNARGGQSNHNFGIAWDVGIFDAKGAYIDGLIQPGKMSNAAVETEYKKIGPVARALGLYWGGDWSKPDRPHVQMLDNDRLDAVRDKFRNGGQIV